MQIIVRLSGELARTGGASRLTVNVPDGASVTDACRALELAAPDLAGVLTRALPIIRGAHVAPDATLTAGDELALLLPAAGGTHHPGDPHGD